MQFCNSVSGFLANTVNLLTECPEQKKKLIVLFNLRGPGANINVQVSSPKVQKPMTDFHSHSVRVPTSFENEIVIALERLCPKIVGVRHSHHPF